MKCYIVFDKVANKYRDSKGGLHDFPHIYKDMPCHYGDITITVCELTFKCLRLGIQLTENHSSIGTNLKLLYMDLKLEQCVFKTMFGKNLNRRSYDCCIGA